MITRLHVSNFRSIGPDFTLDLGPMTALVGPNGSGKSNIADALRFLADCVNTSLAQALQARQGIKSVRRWTAGAAANVDLCVEVTREGGSGFWGFTLASGAEEDGFRIEREYAAWHKDASLLPTVTEFLATLGGSRGVEGRSEISAGGVDFFRLYRDSRAEHNPTYPPGYDQMPDMMLMLPLMFQRGVPALLADIEHLAVYSLFPNSLRLPQAPNPVKPMLGTGDNWASALKSLDRSTWGSELIAGLGRLVGDIDDYRVISAGGFLIPEFRHAAPSLDEPERWHGAAQESDGTLRVAAILTALFQEPAPALIGFEEPELAVHPGALPILHDFLYEATTRSQILLTTHSTDLLDLLPIDDVRVVTRRDGCTTAARVEERQRELVRKRLMSPSDLLHAEGLRPEGGRDDG